MSHRKRLRRKLSIKTLHDESSVNVNFEALVKDEYMKLHRTYRLMEDVRRSITEKGNKASLRGRILEILREQKESIELDLENVTSYVNKQKDKTTIVTILSILEEYDDCLLDIAECIKDVEEMQTNVDKITKRLVEQKLRIQAVFGKSLTLAQTGLKKRTLENRVQSIVTFYDIVLGKIRDIRDEINAMLQERTLFHYRSSIIKRQTNRIKQGMGEIVYHATQAYEQRDEMVSKIHALRERNDKESKQHVVELKEFSRMLHHDSKLHFFMNTKNQNRLLVESNQQTEDRKNQARMIQLTNTLSAYEKSFEEIVRIDDKGLTIEELVVEYLENEQINFANFRFLTDLNNEVSSLCQEAIHLVKEIKNMRKTKEVSDKIRVADLLKLFNVHAKKNLQLDKIIEIWESSETDMIGYIEILDAVFTIANCENSSIIKLLGNLEGISPRNALLCMSVIENRVDDLIFSKQQYEIRKAVEINNAPLPKVAKAQGRKQKHSGGPYEPDISIGGRHDIDEDEDERSHKPLEFHEIRQKLLRKHANLRIPGG